MSCFRSILAFFLPLLPLLSHQIRVVYTSALIDNQFEARKEEYIKSLKALERYGYLPVTYVIEAGPDTPRSFFPQYAQHVFYANTNNLSLKNKGVNEAALMIKGLAHYRFSDEDIVVKITGRYFLDSDKFLKIVETHPDVDAFIKCDAYGQVFTGCYALRTKYMVEMYNQLDLNKMESQSINIEWEAARYIRKLESENRLKVLNIDDLDVTANIFGFGTPELTHW